MHVYCVEGDGEPSFSRKMCDWECIQPLLGPGDTWVEFEFDWKPGLTGTVALWPTECGEKRELTMSASILERLPARD